MRPEGRIDAQHPGYLTGGHQPPWDAAAPYQQPLPEVAPEIRILVHGDFVEAPAVRGPGMAPHFGLDGVDAFTPMRRAMGAGEPMAGEDGVDVARDPGRADGGFAPPGFDVRLPAVGEDGVDALARPSFRFS